MSLRDAAQQALEALEDIFGKNKIDVGAITALRAALAETHTSADTEYTPVEPVAYVTGYSKGYAVVQPVDPCLLMCVGMALYRSPPTISKTETVEPVAWMYTSELAGNQRYITRFQHDLTTYKADKVWPLYAAPPKREPLTEKQIKAIYDALPKKYTLAMFARALELAHDIGGDE